MYNLYLIPYTHSKNYFSNGFSDLDISILGTDYLYFDAMFDEPELQLNLPSRKVHNPTEKYLFPIRIDIIMNKINFSPYLRNFKFTLPDTVVTDIKNNKCKLLFDLSLETYMALSTNYQTDLERLILNTMKQYNLQKSDVILITGNYASIQSNNFMVAIHNWWDTRIKPCTQEFFNLQQSLTLSESHRNKKILNFMRKERRPRIQLAHFIYLNDLKKHNIVTCGKNVQPNFWKRNVDIHPDQQFIDSLPWEYDITLTLSNRNSLMATTDVEREAYTETYINCVVEGKTDYQENHLEITEKCFKPIAYLQPFFFVAQPGVLAHIKDMGFKTFNHLWNEDYDLHSSDQDRFDACTALYKKLSLTSHSELAKLAKEAWPTVEHNYYTYVDYVNSGKSTQHLLKTINESFDK